MIDTELYAERKLKNLLMSDKIYWLFIEFYLITYFPK